MVVRILVVVLILFGAVLSSAPVQADWAVVGAQSQCDGDAFRLVPYVEASSDSGFPALSGFKILPDGRSLLHCRIGKRKLLAEVTVTPPQASGACMGIGAVYVGSLSVDGVELQDHGFALDADCWNDDSPPIVMAEVTEAGGQVALNICVVPHSDDTTGQQAGCETTSINVDRIAKENAKIDHDLADPAVQAAQSALRISAVHDMAKVFALQSDPNGPPICTHWNSYFGWFSEENRPWGRVNGKAGQRAQIYRSNPQLCSTQSQDGCNSSAYVIAGDRLDLGFVCGQWSYVRYRPRLRVYPDTVGWVQTSRLYGLQHLPEPTPLSSTPPTNDPKWREPLLAAVLHDDAQAIAVLTAAGTDPDGPDKTGFPLRVALWRGNNAVIEALLKGGVHLDPEPLGNNTRRDSALAQVAGADRLWLYLFQPRTSGAVVIDPVQQTELLLRFGASVDAWDSDETTPLFQAIERNNVDVVAALLKAGADPNASRGLDDPRYSNGAIEGYTPLMAALNTYADLHDPTAIRLLLAHGAAPDIQIGNEVAEPDDPNYAGETALTIAARNGYLTIAEELLKHGADPVKPRADGSSPQDIAAKAGFTKISTLIEDYAARKTKPKAP